jgi:ubiquinone/menaquinone biosynthesis C-methylase UbiE
MRPFGRRSAETHKAAVDRLFSDDVETWVGYYRSTSLAGVIYQARQRAALAWIDRLGLAPGARSLDVGCGAGELTAELARRGLDVYAVDFSPEMIAQVEGRKLEGVHTVVADVDALPFDDGTFDCIAALGVLPWVHSPVHTLLELARVLRPGGYAVVTSDNARRLTYLLDPRMTPPVQWAKSSVRRLAGRRSVHAAHTVKVIGSFAHEARLEPVAWRTVGFGPFTLLGVPILPDRLGRSLNERLQHAADGGRRSLRGRGSHHLLLLRRA